MFHSGKCPSCEKPVSHVKVEAIQFTAGPYEPYAGVSYLCPECRAVLGVGVDPLALNADVVSQLLTALRKGLERVEVIGLDGPKH
jgi:hypothetical protein